MYVHTVRRTSTENLSLRTVIYQSTFHLLHSFLVASSSKEQKKLCVAVYTVDIHLKNVYSVIEKMLNARRFFASYFFLRQTNKANSGSANFFFTVQA